MNNIEHISTIIQTLNDIKTKPTIENTKKALELLMPRDDNNEMLSRYRIEENNRSKGAIFIPKYNSLYFSHNGMTKWCERQCNDFINDDYVSKEKYYELYNYFWFWSLFHETEHCKQFNIGIAKYPSECTALSEVYKELFDLMLKNESWSSLIPFYDALRMIRQIIYKRNENNLLLERNANIFSFRDMIEIMEKDPHISEEILQLFNALYISNLILGYNETDYPISLTLRTLLKKKKINQLNYNTSLPLLTKMSYGMPIDKKLNDEIIAYLRQNKDDYIKIKKKIYEIMK